MDENKDFLEGEVEDRHEEDEEVIVYLSFEEEEEEVACTVLGIFEVEDKEYMALLAEDDDGILLYEFLEEDEETFDLIPIKDEEELNTVYDAYLALFEEDFEDVEDYEEVEED